MHLSFHRLPRDKKVLKQWVHKIGLPQLAINEGTRVCSEHFVNSRGRPDEVLTLKLPVLPVPRRPLVRHSFPEKGGKAEREVMPIIMSLTGADIESLLNELAVVKEKLKQTQQNVHFRLQHISEILHWFLYYVSIEGLL